MSRSISPRHGMPVLMTLMLALSGCVQTASYHVWRPAKTDISGINRLAVLDFRGPSDSGQIARSTLVTQLSQNGFYSLVDQSQLGYVSQGVPLRANAARDLPAAIEAARAQGVDAILVGDVVSYSVADDVYRNQEFGFTDGSHKDGKKGDSGRTFGLHYANNETVNREVSASLAFQLIDVRTGRIRAANQSSYTLTGQMTNGEGYLPARERALTELMHKCARDIVTTIAPHQVPFDVELASQSWGAGSSNVRSGNEAAVQGDWSAAAQYWQAALDENEQNHAAHYNLAIACEAQENYPRARELLAQAADIEAASLYVAAARRLSGNHDEYLRVLAQRDARTRPTDPIAPAYAGTTPPQGSNVSAGYGTIPAGAQLPARQAYRGGQASGAYRPLQ